MFFATDQNQAKIVIIVEEQITLMEDAYDERG